MKTALFKDLQIGEIFIGMETGTEYVKIGPNKTRTLHTLYTCHFFNNSEVFLTNRMDLKTVILAGKERFENENVASI
jgi:hypothetical protein